MLIISNKEAGRYTGNMKFYQVLPASPRYHGHEPLTYSSPDNLKTGAVVVIPLGPQKILGIISGGVAKPTFTTKPIVKLIDAGAVPPQMIDLINWLRLYYPAPLGAIVNLLLPGSLAQKARATPPSGSVATTSNHLVPTGDRQPQPPLNPQQQTAVERISRGSERSYLLHGQTGTGKTRVYIELIKETLDAGRSALVLTPEIGLTPQLALTLQQAFGPVIIMHSTLTPAERRQAWLQIANALRPQVIVGPRSALFTPIQALGIIIIDEAHDGAYKQEQAPHYQASRVAATLAAAHRAKLVLGTATPLISDYYAFQHKNLPIISLTDPAVVSNFKRTITIVDRRDKTLFGRSYNLSDQLISRISTSLSAGEQSLVFLNRRGSARLVTCTACGWESHCPRCDLPLTFHADTHQARCHTCGYAAHPPSSCPDCQSTDIIYKSIGTKTIVTELQRMFPAASISRFDGDTSKADRLEAQYQSIASGQVDILVGTQVLAKGLDLPRLSTVGVVAADTSLHFPDFSAEERTYQMITQVIGRVGRGHRDSSVVIQSFHPDNPTLQAATTQDYAAHYQQQLLERKLYRFPPYFFLLKIIISRKSQAGAIKTANTLHAKLAELCAGASGVNATTASAGVKNASAGAAVELTDPSPAFTEKVNNSYRWHIVARSPSRASLLTIVAALPGTVTYDLDPTNLL